VVHLLLTPVAHAFGLVDSKQIWRPKILGRGKTADYRDCTDYADKVPDIFGVLRGSSVTRNHKGKMLERGGATSVQSV
jgi:hypothetical protein